MSALVSSLRTKITSRSARTGVVGLGYVGLPLAVEFAWNGFHTTGIDLDQRKIDAIAEGRSYIPDVSTAGLAAPRLSTHSASRARSRPASPPQTPAARR